MGVPSHIGDWTHLPQRCHAGPSPSELTKPRLWTPEAAPTSGMRLRRSLRPLAPGSSHLLMCSPMCAYMSLSDANAHVHVHVHVTCTCMHMLTCVHVMLLLLYCCTCVSSRTPWLCPQLEHVLLRHGHRFAFARRLAVVLELDLSLVGVRGLIRTSFAGWAARLALVLELDHVAVWVRPTPCRGRRVNERLVEARRVGVEREHPQPARELVVRRVDRWLRAGQRHHHPSGDGVLHGRGVQG